MFVCNLAALIASNLSDSVIPMNVLKPSYLKYRSDMYTIKTYNDEDKEVSFPALIETGRKLRGFKEIKVQNTEILNQKVLDAKKLRDKLRQDILAAKLERDSQLQRDITTIRYSRQAPKVFKPPLAMTKCDTKPYPKIWTSSELQTEEQKLKLAQFKSDQDKVWKTITSVD